MDEIECDKCGSHKVTKMLAVKPEPPKRPIFKMSEVATGKVPHSDTTVYAVMTYSTYKLRCDNCGFETEPFTENDQLGTLLSTVSIQEKPHREQPLQVNPKSHHYE